MRFSAAVFGGAFGALGFVVLVSLFSGVSVESIVSGYPKETVLFAGLWGVLAAWSWKK